MALPRVLLAVLIGAVVSTPLALAVFGAEIDAELQVVTLRARRRQRPARCGQQVNRHSGEAGGHRDPAGGHRRRGDRCRRPGSPALVDLQGRVDAARARWDDAAAAVQCETTEPAGQATPAWATCPA